MAITGGLISGIGGTADPEPTAERVIDAGGGLVTPGLVNTHHHLFQNLTRAYPPMTSAPLFGWLQSLYPLWTDALDEEAADQSDHPDGGQREQALTLHEAPSLR